MPDFFIVGSPKTGTSSLHKMLSGHPQIYMPHLKEPRFLASDMRPRPEHAQGPRELGYPTTLEAYLALFADAAPEQRVGEATSTYLWSRTAASAIADLQPAARIIAILREPAGFLRSLHLTFLKGRNEAEKSLSKAMSLEPARRAGRHIPRSSHRPQLLQYSEHVRYVEQLQRYHARFSPEQVLVLIYDDFRDDNAATVRRVLRFLQVDETQPLKPSRANPTVGVRSQRLQGLVHAVAAGEGPLSRAVHSAARTLAPRGVRGASAAAIRRRIVFGEPEPPDERLMVELRRRFKPEVVALSEYLDRDLVGLWGYDVLD